MSETPPISSKERDVTRLVSAATDALIERGPAAVSLREIAAKAGVNYGLIHQYVGTKEDLLRLVIRHGSADAAARMATARTLDEALDYLLDPVAPTPYLLMFARIILDGHDLAAMQGRSPALLELVDRLAERRSGPDGGPSAARDDAVTAAALVSAMMGWRLFDRFLQRAVGLDDQPLSEVSAAVLGRIRDGLLPPSPSA
jgi:AcrR family transcriptional regulator